MTSPQTSSPRIVNSDRRRDGFVSVREVARTLGVGRQRVRTAAEQGRIPRPRRRFGKKSRPYYRLQDLPKIAAAFDVRVPPPPVPNTMAELFCGVGLFREALEPLGWQATYAVDSAKTKCDGYENRHGDRPHKRDVGDVETVARHMAEAGPVGLLTAGWPCTDASVAGRGAGVAGADTGAVFALTNVIRRQDARPAVLLFENVPGLYEQHPEDLRVVLRMIGGLGYAVSIFELNASHFVPQSRRRIYIVGALPHVAAGVSEFGDTCPLRPPRLHEAVAPAGPPAGWLSLRLPKPPERAVELADILDASDGANWLPPKEAAHLLSELPSSHRQRLLVGAASEPSGYLVRVARRERRNGRRTLEVNADGVASTILSQGGDHPIVVRADTSGSIDLRAMRACEYAALQGARHVPVATEAAARRIYGDGVCVPAVRWIGREVIAPLVGGVALHPTPP